MVDKKIEEKAFGFDFHLLVLHFLVAAFLRPLADELRVLPHRTASRNPL